MSRSAAPDDSSLGRALSRRIDGRRFLLYVHVGLVLVGGMLLIRAIRRFVPDEFRARLA